MYVHIPPSETRVNSAFAEGRKFASFAAIETLAWIFIHCFHGSDELLVLHL